MSDFIVDESRFMLDDGAEDTSFFKEGFVFPDGIAVGETLDEGVKWQLYVSEDAKTQILAVKAELAQKWLEGKFLTPEKLLRFPHEGQDYYLLFSPSNLRLERVTNSHFRGSLRYALNFYAAVWNARLKDADVSLRDALYCELYSVMLPTFTLVPAVTDKALFKNALRNEKQEGEDLTGPTESEKGALSFYFMRTLLKERGISLPAVPPYLESGDPLEEFMGVKQQGAVITGPLVMRAHYQIYDTDADCYVLLMDRLWAEALLSTPIINRMNLTQISVRGQMLCVMTLSKRKAAEPLDDRSYGIDEVNAYALARAVRRTRDMLPGAKLDNALYLEDLGVLLPESFEGGSDDLGLVRSVLLKGPFAMAPLYEEIVLDCINMVRR